MESFIAASEKRIIEKKSKKTSFPFLRMNSAYFTVGLIFLMNPAVNVFDILPDALGYYFIYLALDELKRLDGNIEFGCIKLKTLTAISFAEFCTLFIVTRLDSSWVLSLTFAFCILKCAFTIVAFNEIFKGITYLLQRFGGDGELPDSGDAYFSTIVFEIIRSVCIVGVELWALADVALLNADSDEEAFNLSKFIDFKPFGILVSLIVCLAIGIYWFVTVKRYIKSVRKDKDFISALKPVYISEILENRCFYTGKRIKAGLLIISAGYLMFMDLTANKVHVMPEAVGYALIAVGTALICGKRAKKVFCVAAVASVFWAVYYFFRTEFPIETAFDNTHNAKYIISDMPWKRCATAAVCFIPFAASALWFIKTAEECVSDIALEIFDEKIYPYFYRAQTVMCVMLLCAEVYYICPALRIWFSTLHTLFFLIWFYLSTRVYREFSRLL